DATAELAPLLRDVVLPALGARPRLGTVAVFTGSASGSDPGFARAAGAFVRTAAAGGVSIVYGGGKVGLMGVVADAALAAGGAVHGVIPQALVDGEIAHAELTQLEVVPDMHTRKNRMAELADGFVALPGGAGTPQGLYEEWIRQLLDVHAELVALCDVVGLLQPLLAVLDRMVAAVFLAPRFRDSVIGGDVPADPLEQVARWQPHAP